MESIGGRQHRRALTGCTPAIVARWPWAAAWRERSGQRPNQMTTGQEQRMGDMAPNDINAVREGVEGATMTSAS